MKPNLKPLIQSILEAHPETREYEIDLVRKTWAKQLPESRHYTLDSISHFIKVGVLASYESICRISRLVKNQHPELKGTRKRKTEQQVITDLKQLEKV